MGIFGALLGACTLDVEVGYDELESERVARVPATFRHELDLLFVVDDTAGMASVQAELGAMWRRMRGHLAYAEGGFPAVRVGVISTDLAIEGTCAGGDDGRLLPFGDAAWLDVDPVAPEGADGAIEARLQLGEGGCAYEQPIEALWRALEAQPANDGFVRDGAALGVVFVAGDDDCSVVDPAFLGGGGGKFACFREGVRCADDVYAGEQTGCRPRDSDALADVDGHQRYLQALKGDRDAVAVAAILGNPAEVTIVEDGGALGVSPACTEPAAGATPLFPGVRLGALAEMMGGEVVDLCTTPAEAAGTPAGYDLRRALGHRCLEGRVADVEPDEPGLQVACDVLAIAPSGAETRLAACPNPDHVWDTTGPCYAIKPGPAECGDFPTQLALQVNWGGPDPTTAPPDTITEVHCIVDPGTPPVP